MLAIFIASNSKATRLSFLGDLAVTFINIGDLVTFSSNNGVQVHKKAIDVSAEDLYTAITTAFSHMEDPALVDACCGGRGPLAQFFELSYEEYIEILRQIEIANAGALAKQQHTRLRRLEFNSKRSSLVLNMIDSGIPYVCAHPNCEVTANLTVDHIIALSHGGGDNLENLQFLCLPHNSAKGDRN
ncbi:HNH endonuclease [Xanthomonas sp. SHU 199]|uniref:HNH endonuclease n=1 Tax=Xanthomonas sp. SHU 199 TaxID=1591174 RepID=UPI0009DA67DA|nr:HNH endonuclease signature motif containing protein [Xanthomonas sp. SHU 199]